MRINASFFSKKVNSNAKAVLGRFLKIARLSIDVAGKSDKYIKTSNY